MKFWKNPEGTTVLNLAPRPRRVGERGKAGPEFRRVPAFRYPRYLRPGSVESGSQVTRSPEKREITNVISRFSGLRVNWDGLGPKPLQAEGA